MTLFEIKFLFKLSYHEIDSGVDNLNVFGGVGYILHPKRGLIVAIFIYDVCYMYAKPLAELPMPTASKIDKGQRKAKKPEQKTK